MSTGWVTPSTPEAQNWSSTTICWHVTQLALRFLLRVSCLIYDAYVSLHTSPWRHERMFSSCAVARQPLSVSDWASDTGAGSWLMVWFRRVESGLCKQSLVWQMRVIKERCTFPYRAPELHLLSSSDWSVYRLCKRRLWVTYTQTESKRVRKEKGQERKYVSTHWPPVAFWAHANSLK